MDCKAGYFVLIALCSSSWVASAAADDDAPLLLRLYANGGYTYSDFSTRTTFGGVDQVMTPASNGWGASAGLVFNLDFTPYADPYIEVVHLEQDDRQFELVGAGLRHNFRLDRDELIPFLAVGVGYLDLKWEQDPVPAPADAEESGRSLALPPGSAAGPALAQLNKQLMERKLAPIVAEWVDPTLAVEDVLEMVQAGVYPATVVEQTIAQRWAKVMPKLRIEQHLSLGEKTSMHWFVRKEASMLRASADRFLKDYDLPDNQDAAFERVYRRLYKVQYPLDRVGRQRLEKVRPTLQRYAEQIELDWLNLAALAFKESTLNPAARGAGGATGLMQVTPATARAMGVSNVQQLDNNVQASARYLANIRRNHFASPRLNERERMAFILAAYNLGPQRVQSMRAEARRRGLNPDQWFFQVERIAMETVGMGVVAYVNSVNKYYLAYQRERYLLEADRKTAAN